MTNVIAFPQKAAESRAVARAPQATTLFLHIRRTTLIAHLGVSTPANRRSEERASKR